MNRLSVPVAASQLNGADVDRNVAHQLGQLAVGYGLGEVSAQRVADLSSDFVCVFHQTREGAVLADPFGRRFLTDTRNAWQVVARVAPQCCEVGVLLR